MANKYSKSNQSSNAREEKIMREYEERRKRLNIGGKIMAIIIIITMVLFTIISGAAFLFD